MKTRFLLLFVFSFTAVIDKAQAQPFFLVGSGTDDVILSLYADTANNNLYVGGQFSFAGGIQCNGIAKWDGLAWDSLQNNLIPDNDVKAINTLNGELYIGGGVGFIDTSSGQGQLAGITKWDAFNNSWIRIDTPKTNGVVYGIMNYNNNLYVTGQFDTIGGIYSSKIARYDGTNWHSFPSLDTNGGGTGLMCSVFYNGDLYVGGNYISTTGPNLSDLAKWDGSQWVPVGNGLSGFGWITDFAIYQGKLIIAGWMNTAWGEPGNGVAAWDGVQWTQLGTGLSPGTVWSVEVYNGELWAGGGILDAGGIPVTSLAKWNGSQWAGLPVTLGNVVTSMAVVGNDLYIAGGSWAFLNGDTAKYIMRYNYLTGFETLYQPKKDIEVYPNPFPAKLTITTHNNSLSEIILYDMASRKLLQQKFTNIVTLNTAQLAKGMYVYEVRNEKGMVRKGKVVKE